MSRLPRNLPPWVEPQPLPADPQRSRLIDISGWWLDVHCACGRGAALPLRLMAANRPTMRLGDFAARLSCEACGQRPARLRLVDNPARLGGHHAGGAPARAIVIPV